MGETFAGGHKSVVFSLKIFRCMVLAVGCTFGVCVRIKGVSFIINFKGRLHCNVEHHVTNVVW